MRKFFTLIGAALLSLTSLHATVETKDITWTLTAGGNTFALDAWGNMETKWGWTEGCAEYDQLVFEFGNPTGDIVVKAQFNDGTNDIASTAVLHVGDNSLAVNVTADVLHSVDVKNFSGAAQTITLNRMYLRRTVGAKQTETLWSGSMEFSDWKAWGDRLVIAPEKFAGIRAGDLIQLEYSVSDSYQQINLISPYNSYKMAFVGVLDGDNYNINSEANPSELTFAILSEDDIANLQTQGGLSINAVHITLTAVKLIKHETLWTGTQVIGEWSGSTRVEASKLANLKAGETLCIRVSALTEGGQVFLQYDNGDWSTFEPTVNYIFTGSDEAPMVVEIPVTSKMEQQLRGNDLIVQGLNYTMTDIYIPGNKIATYLDVTSAGMSTYVLPFNVPTLPDGVKAYRLTNDGSNVIEATEQNVMTADQPVLIVAEAGEYEFISEDDASDDVSGKTETYQDGALIGTYVGINPVPASYAPVFNYVLQNGVEGVGFYKVTANDCTLAPYRAYLSCGYDAMAGGSSAPMRIRFREDTATGVENAQAATNVQKLLIDGQLYIIRDGVTYTIQGQIVK